MHSTQHLGDVVLVESRLPKQSSYAVVWHDGRGPARAGKLELRDNGLRLETGRRDGRLQVLALRYDALATVRMAYGRERLGGCPTLILDRPGNDSVLVSCIACVGSLSELGEALARRTQAFAA